MAKANTSKSTASMARMHQMYLDTIKDSLMKEFSYKNVMQAPKLQKIVLNMGVGEAALDKKVMEAAVNDMTLIAGQKRN